MLTQWNQTFLEKMDRALRNSYVHNISALEEARDKLPVPVVHLANTLGISVYEANGWDGMLYGKIVKGGAKSGESGYAIFVNAELSESMKRFTIAHEIAHFILHKEQIGEGISDDMLYRGGVSNLIEKEATELATYLLMPWRHLSRELDVATNTISDLAEKFKVPRSAMSIRLGVPYDDPPES